MSEMSEAGARTDAGIADPRPPDPDQRLGASYYKLFAGTVVSNLGDGMARSPTPGWLRRSRATRS